MKIRILSRQKPTNQPTTVALHLGSLQDRCTQERLRAPKLLSRAPWIDHETRLAQLWPITEVPMARALPTPAVCWCLQELLIIALQLLPERMATSPARLRHKRQKRRSRSHPQRKQPRKSRLIRPELRRGCRGAARISWFCFPRMMIGVDLAVGQAS